MEANTITNTLPNTLLPYVSLFRSTSGQTEKEIVVETLSDQVINEPDESVILALSNPSNATIATSPGTGLIADATELPTVSIADAPTVNEAGDLVY